MNTRYRKALLAMSMTLFMGAGCDSCSTTEACFDENGDSALCTTPDADMAFDEGVVTPDMPVADVGEEMDLRETPDADMTPLVDMCQPMPRELACNNVCGMQADGCGGMIDCGEPLTPAEACQGVCGEQSDGCGGMVTCEPCACENGTPLEPRCGTCQLGRSTCDGDTFTCESYDIPGLTPASDCESEVIYVNARTVTDTPDGSLAAPFNTLAEATTAASERGAKVILVGGGITDKYNETLEVLDGVSVIGGWDFEWLPDDTRTPIIEPLIGDTPSDLFGARAIDIIDRDTLVAHLQIITPNIAPSTDGPGFNNYGFYIRNAQTLRLDSLVIEVGDGGDGTNGQKGRDGDDGIAGKQGSSGIWSNERVLLNYTNAFMVPDEKVHNSVPLGVLPGLYYSAFMINSNPQSQFCDPSNIALKDNWGGLGGDGGGQILDETTYKSGTRGQPTSRNTWLGGLASNTMANDGGTGNPVSQSRSDDGEPGVVLYDVDSDRLIYAQSASAMPGSRGLNGEGGSGGGALHQQSTPLLLLEKCRPDPFGGGMMCSFLNVGAFGPGGGNGGNGGCGGSGGKHGHEGGSSAGIFALDTSLQIVNSSIRSRSGGDGGSGGEGGVPGLGGEGGAGSSLVCKGRSSSDCMSLTGISSGKGGDGRVGQPGGYGGGGAGGGSFGIYCRRASIALEKSQLIEGVPGDGGGDLASEGESGLSASSFDCQ